MSKGPVLLGLPVAAVAGVLLHGVVSRGLEQGGGGDAPRARPVRGSASVETVDYTITPVAGPSLVRELGRGAATIALGRVGRVGSATSAEPLQGREIAASFVMTGEDLYRLACRSCHESDGRGRPPRIRSLIPAVRGASPGWLRADFTRRGFPVNDTLLAGVTTDARQDLRERLTRGSERMPAFDFLSAREVDALAGYLRTLAGVPDAPAAPTRLRGDFLRVGELLVKGTCHTCHDATAPDVGAEAPTRGAIPPLASFTRNDSVEALVGAVREGRPIAPDATSRSGDLMPAFGYLTPAEVAAAYFYLSLYPPHR